MQRILIASKVSKCIPKRVSTAIKASAISLLLSGTAVPAQERIFDDSTPNSQIINQLYECGALYSVQYGCFKNENTAENLKTAAIAQGKQNIVVYLLYLYSKRSGLSEDDFFRSIVPSTQGLMKTMSNRCENISVPNARIGPTCDLLIRNPPRHPYDDEKQQKAGQLGTKSTSPNG